MRKQFVKSNSDGGSQVTSTSKTSTDANNTRLSKEEKAALDKCVATITKGLGSYVEIGAAFKKIKDKQLHRDHKVPFYDYCKKVLGMSKAHVNRSIQASDCATHIETAAPIGAYAVPRNEGSARIIAGLPPEDQLKVAQLVKKTVGDAIPTAEDFKKAKDQVCPPKEKPPTKSNKVVLRMKEDMGLGDLNEAALWAQELANKENASEEMRKTLNDVVAIVGDYLKQLESPDMNLPAPHNTTHP